MASLLASPCTAMTVSFVATAPGERAVGGCATIWRSRQALIVSRHGFQLSRFIKWLRTMALDDWLSVATELL